ncbi:MAG: choice-of-anchor Q domain-containing protein [Bacteroidota bacterium]
MKKALLLLLAFGLFALQSTKAQSNATLAADIIPGMDPSMPSYLTAFNGKLYFTANDNTFDQELYEYNGTTATKININATGSSSPSGLIVFNNKLYFTADNGTNGSELMVYDPTTPTSATLVTDINPGANSSFISSLAVFNNKLYFNADNGINGSSLWECSTTNVTSIVTGGAGIQPLGFTVYNSELYFKANDPTNGDEVWKYDGTNPPSMVQDIRSGSVGSFPMSFIVYNGILYFNADDGINGGELWKYNGTTATLAADINTSPASGSNPSEFAVFNNKLYFAADEGINGTELWQFNGTTASMAHDIYPGGTFNSSGPTKLFAYGDTLYFNAWDGVSGVEIWKLGYTGAPIMQDLNPGPDPSFFDFPAIFNNKLYFQADNGSTGAELYFLNNACDATATLSGGASVCRLATAPILTFTGSNSVSPYTFSYRINGGAVQTLTTAGTIATLSVPTATAGAFTYTLVSVAANGCSIAQSGSAVVTVNTLPTASLSGGATVCQNATAPVLTFTGANGTSPYTFNYRINGGAIQTLTTASTVATLSASTTGVGVFTYTLVSVASNGCSQAQTGSAIVTVNGSPTASIDGTTNVCELSTDPIITFTGANATAPYNFMYRINGGTLQTITTANTIATLTAPTTLTGVYSYTLESVYTSACSQVQTGSAVITVNGLPSASISAGATICKGSPSPILSFTATGGTNPYEILYYLNGNLNSINITTGNLATLSIPTNNINTYTYDLLAVQDNNTCNAEFLSTSIFTINPKPVVNLVQNIDLITLSPQILDAKNAGATYAWSTGATTQVVTLTNIGTYTVDVTNLFGCTTQSTVKINYTGPKTIFVKAGASGAADGTSWANAYTSVVSALAIAKTGDSIFVATGNYTGSLEIQKGISLYGGFAGTESFLYQRAVVTTNHSILQASANKPVVKILNTRYITTDTFVVLDGFVITGATNTSDYGGGISIQNSTVNIINCIIQNNTAEQGSAIYLSYNSKVDLINCIVKNNSTSGIPNVNVIHSVNGPDLTLNNCLIYNNNTTGFVIYNIYFGTLKIINSTISENTSKVIWASDCRVDLFNSIIYNQSINNIFNFADNNMVTETIKNSLIRGMGANTTNQNIDGTQTYDLFVDAANSDYRLKPTAIAVNAGSNALVSTYTTTDLAGNPRTFDTYVDMGAYELQTPQPPLPGVVCVKPGGAGLQNGDGWANAFANLQTAITSATVGQVIAVAAGTYTPAAGQSFSMKEGVSMYGGFAGTETNLNQRDLSITSYTTVLKGNGNSVINNFNSSITTLTVLDGFTITGGNSSGYGGGIHNFGSSPTIRNCIIKGNYAKDGGGICNRSNSSRIENCNIIGNSSEYGGGIYCQTDLNQTIINCSIGANSATVYAGGIYSYGYFGFLNIINCSIGGNTAVNYPSGTGIALNYYAGATISNSIVYNTLYGDRVIIKNSLVLGKGADATNANGTANIQNLFVDAANGDLHLGSGANSAGVINKGSDDLLPNNITTDLAGNTRKYRAAVDMGCYELFSPKSTNITVSTNPNWVIKNSRNILSDLQISNPEQKDLQTHYSLLQLAIDAAYPGDSIYVEKGIYTPGIDSAFVMKEGVHIFGGFNGTETSFAERDLSAGHVSVLRGNGTSVISNDDNRLTNDAELNGFTIENGTGKDIEGITYGGAVYNYNASPTISNCIIKNNQADYGGAIFNDNNSKPAILRSQMLNNSAYGDGAAVYSNYNSAASITNCLIKGNSATNYGGAVYSNFMSDNKITNSTLVNNTAGLDGGALVANSSTISMANSIVLNNTASSNAGVYAFNAGATNITYSLTQDITTGTGNLNGATTYTLFVNEATNNYRLKCGVAAIDAGNNDSIPSNGIIELAQNSRTYDGTVDLGAYEYGAFSRPKAAKRQTVCSNGDIVFKSYISDASGATYQWMKAPNGSNTFTAIGSAIKDSLLLSAVAQADSGSRYFVQITNGCGVLHSDTVMLKVNRLPLVNLGADRAVCANLSPALEANNYGEMLWSDGSNNANFPLLNSGNYSLQLTDLNGCVATDDVNIVVNTVDTLVTVNLSTLTVSHANATSYQWIKSDGVSSYTLVSGETSQSFTATEDGDYAVIVNTAEGCVDTSAYKSIVNVSVKENEISKTILGVYPNPTNGDLTISASEEMQLIEITDVVGRVIYSEKPIATKHTLNLATEPRGVYFVKVSSKLGTDVVKIIKQ